MPLSKIVQDSIDSSQVLATTGIKFPATQVASTDANTLDDYEEGTWTPELAFSGSSTGVTYGSRIAHYTKVGGVVNAYCYLGISNKGSATGSAQIVGLPFACNANYITGCIWQSGISYSGTFQGFLTPTATIFNIQQTSDAGTNTNITNSAFPTSGVEIMLNVTYRVN